MELKRRSKEELIEVLKQHELWLESDLSGADLSGADLTFVNLTDAFKICKDDSN